MSQYLSFVSTDTGPCYLTLEEKESKRLDKVTGKSKLKDLNKSELVERLKRAGITDPRGTKAKLQDKCKEMGIPIQADVPVVL